MSSARKAMRLFAVLVAGCERLATPGSHGETAIFKGETRLYALMFWLRNPDYLAWELLELHAAIGDAARVALVRAMLAAEEPVMRRCGLTDADIQRQLGFVPDARKPSDGLVDDDPSGDTPGAAPAK